MNASYQLFDALPAHIEDALRASIERFGVLVPVVKDQHGNIIDGHHRARIAEPLGAPYRVDVVQVADEDEAREIARTLNADRRQLTEEQRRRIPGCDHGIASFRARHIYPRSTPWKECTPQQIAGWIDSLHAAHNASHHTTIGRRVA
ncbi:MAG TPA: ParB N-terminal domain-containing protein [Marmoricola sp.]|nr:ParB N-terminal domain-containing protein [Marmoricola sp.]